MLKQRWDISDDELTDDDDDDDDDVCVIACLLPHCPEEAWWAGFWPWHNSQEALFIVTPCSLATVASVESGI